MMLLLLLLLLLLMMMMMVVVVVVELLVVMSLALVLLSKGVSRWRGSGNGWWLSRLCRLTSSKLGALWPASTTCKCCLLHGQWGHSGDYKLWGFVMQASASAKQQQSGADDRGQPSLARRACLLCMHVESVYDTCQELKPRQGLI